LLRAFCSLCRLQVLEAHTITILARKPKRLVLAGDPKQLPALTKSQLSKKGLFCRSMMERLYELGPDGPTHKLLRQYRMHPEICHFPREVRFLRDSFPFQTSLVRASLTVCSGM
jgi:hypothetical protein